MAAVLIEAVLILSQAYGIFHAVPLALMSALVAVAVYVYFNFAKALRSAAFTALGPPVIGIAAVGVALMWTGAGVGAALVALAYLGEPVMGYFVYKRLREVNAAWATLFLASAAAYAYTLPTVLLGYWQIPAAADAIKLAALIYFLRR